MVNSHVQLHFMVLCYLLEGPTRAVNDLIVQFELSNFDTAYNWVRQAERLRLVRVEKIKTNGTHKLQIKPLKILGEAQ